MSSPLAAALSSHLSTAVMAQPGLIRLSIRVMEADLALYAEELRNIVWLCRGAPIGWMVPYVCQLRISIRLLRQGIEANRMYAEEEEERFRLQLLEIMDDVSTDVSLHGLDVWEGGESETIDFVIDDVSTESNLQEPDVFEGSESETVVYDHELSFLGDDVFD